MEQRPLPRGAELRSPRGTLYRIEAVIGAGGFGVTYRASVEHSADSDETRLGQLVALKEFYPVGCADRDDMGRVFSTSADGNFERFRDHFVQERARVATVQHRAIIKYLDHFSCDGNYFNVLRYVAGETLRSRVTRQPLNQNEAELLFLNLADGLQALHRNDIIHRDVKPTNIMLRSEFSEETGMVEPVLIDFGGARLAFSETSIVLGSSMFPAEDTQDERVDIFGLGASLYVAVLGRLPPAAAELARPVALVQLDEAEKAGRVDPRIATVIRGCLAPAEQRYRRIQDIIDQYNAAGYSNAQPAHQSAKPRTGMDFTVGLLNVMVSLSIVAIVSIVSIYIYDRRLLDEIGALISG